MKVEFICDGCGVPLTKKRYRVQIEKDCFDKDPNMWDCYVDNDLCMGCAGKIEREIRRILKIQREKTEVRND